MVSGASLFEKVSYVVGLFCGRAFDHVHLTAAVHVADEVEKYLTQCYVGDSVPCAGAHEPRSDYACDGCLLVKYWP